MSERAPRPERLVALFVTVLWAALSFAVDGFLALILGRDPIEAEASGPGYAILSFLLAGLVVWMLVAGTSVSRHPWWGTIAAVAAVYLLSVAVAAAWSLQLAAEQITSPFLWAACVLAGAAVAGTWAAFRATRRRTRPPDIERIP